MLVDDINITITAGHGGPGKVSTSKRSKLKPHGGKGGRGGDIYVTVTSDLLALNRFSGLKEIKAKDGHPGGSNNRSGKDGQDTEVQFPIGTSITDLETHVVIELTTLGQRILLCKGGLGGRGDYELKSFAQPGLSGKSMPARLILKYLAKYGLIGLPNAGKSSLLNELTNAHAEVGDYPFTTLEANLGVINGQIIADIPGLIEGASRGRGLGIKFLKHIEKVSLLFHCIAADSPNIARDYHAISVELEKFDPQLIKKPQVIVLTKTDLVSSKTIQEHIKNLKKFKHLTVPVSIHDSESLSKLKEYFIRDPGV